MSLYSQNGAPAEALLREVRAFDPRTAIDEVSDVLVREGEIAQIAAPGSIEPPPGAEVIDGAGKHLLPGFIDPHVHLRTPGRSTRRISTQGRAPPPQAATAP